MSANATGTPTTNFSIPKFNTASDAPNGKGTNEMMDAIDSLLQAGFTQKPAGIVANEMPMWSGTAWTRSPAITSSALSGGPPGSPKDGDIWIATAVDSNGTVWSFRYNAGSASSFKWEFIGGTPLVNSSAIADATNTPVGTATFDGRAVIAIARAGDYDVRFVGDVVVAANAFMVVQPAISGGTLGSPGSQIAPNNAGSSMQLAFAAQSRLTFAASSNAAGCWKQFGATGCTMGDRTLTVVPVRIS